MADIAQEKQKNFHKGQLIFKEGVENPVAYMVKKGSVVLYRVVNNKRVVLTTIQPGQMVGETAMVLNQPFHANAEAAEYTECLVVDRQLLATMLVKCPNPIQRLVKTMAERLRALGSSVCEQSVPNVFYAVCQVLDLMHRTGDGEARPGRAVSYADFARTVKNMFLITQLEIDEIVERLMKLNVVTVQDVKGAKYSKNALGEMNKTGEFLQDRYVAINDPASFLSVAKNMAKGSGPSSTPPYTDGMEFVDLHAFAAMADATPEMVYKKIGNREVPETLFFIPRRPAQAWLDEVGKDYFKKTKRKKLNLDELESVADIVFVDNATLRAVFQAMGFHKLAMLHAAASAGGEDEAVAKMEANFSKKIKEVVAEEADGMLVDEAELAEVEEELFDTVRKLKASKK